MQETLSCLMNRSGKDDRPAEANLSQPKHSLTSFLKISFRGVGAADPPRRVCAIQNRHDSLFGNEEPPLAGAGALPVPFPEGEKSSSPGLSASLRLRRPGSWRIGGLPWGTDAPRYHGHNPAGVVKLILKGIANVSPT